MIRRLIEKLRKLGRRRLARTAGVMTFTLAFLLAGGLATAQVLSPGRSGGVLAPGLWTLTGNVLSPTNSSWELGSSSDRIAKGWFTDLDATTMTISGSVGGDLLPDTDDSYDLGSTSFRWKDLHLSGTGTSELAYVVTATNTAALDIQDGEGNSVLTVDTSASTTTATGDLSVTGRLEAAAHADGAGFKLTTNAGVPVPVSGTVEGDAVWDTSGDTLYIYDGSAFTTAAAGGDVTASSTMSDNALIRGDGGSKGIQDSGITVDDSDNLTGVASITVDNSGLHIFDTGGDHDLILATGDDFAADRTLTVTMNDASRGLDLGGDLTIAGNFTTSGGDPLTLTTTGSTNVTLPTSGTLLANVVEDTTPQLGGDLDAQSNSITDFGNLTFKTGSPGGTLRTGTSADDTFHLQAYDTDDSVYRDLIRVTAGGTVTLDLRDGSTIGGSAILSATNTATLTNKTFDANGTGNSLSNVDVADLANGTDGELITWDSSGSPATVGAGTSGQVLTSNGAGAAPTFQDAAGGGSVLFDLNWSHENDGRFQDITVNSGSVTYSTSGAAYATGATQGSSAKSRDISKIEDLWHSYNSQFTTVFAVTGASAGAGTVAAVAGKVDISGTGYTGTNDHYGFVVEYSGGTATLYASSSEGTTQEKTDVTSGITVTNTNLYSAEFDGTTVTFYINGTQVATHSTNVPDSTGGVSFETGVSNNDTTDTLTAEFAATSLKLKTD